MKLTQTGLEPKLSFVTLADDGVTLLLNGEEKYSSSRLPMDLSKKKPDELQKALEVEIRNTCNANGLDYVSSDNIMQRAKEAVDLLEDMWVKARAGMFTTMSRTQMESESLDITSEALKLRGYRLVNEGPTMAFYYNGSCKRTGLDKDDWDGSWRKLEKKLKRDGFPQEVISEVDSCMATNYPKLMKNGKGERGGVVSAVAHGDDDDDEDSNNNNNTTPEEEQQTIIELTADLTKEVSWDTISRILSTSIKKDENPKLITFNGMLLAQTNDDQLNLGFQAESSVGKSYIPLDVATYFAENEVQKIASASPTAFYHSGAWDPDRKALIVDLRHKILIFLDMPHFQLLERLRPLLSHDDTKLNYKITDKSQKYGLKTKDVLILGPPTVCFCSAKTNPDDQEKTRMILLSPSTDEEKLRESLELLTLKKSDPQEYLRLIMKDPDRVWLTKRIMCVRQGSIREVKVPDGGKAVFERFMKEHDHLMPRHQRDYPRIFSFIKAHALLNCFNREKLSEDTILANEKDIDAGFALYKGIEQSNEMGLSPYILKIYDDVFMPILTFNEGVSREDVLKQYYKARHKPMSPEVLRLEIIPQLEAVGLIYQEEGERRKMLVYPTVSHTYNKSLVKAAEAAAAAAHEQDNARVIESQKLFWQTYDALENKETRIVIESSFKTRLVSTGSFIASEAQQEIKEAVEKGELTRLEYDVLRKPSTNSEEEEGGGI